MAKCINCGAELKDGECEYCGSVYAELKEFHTEKVTKTKQTFIDKLFGKIEDLAENITVKVDAHIEKFLKK